MEHLKIVLSYTIFYSFVFCIGLTVMFLAVDLLTYLTCVDCDFGWQTFELTFKGIRVGFYAGFGIGITAGIVTFAMKQIMSGRK
jgi:hypothetical protein